MSQPLAYLNQAFLESGDARPIRILAEYLEPLRRFKQQKIQDTVVFFGSARVDSRERAERALATLRARGESDADEQYQKELLKSRKAVEWAKYYEEARELAGLLTAWSLTLPCENHRFVTSGGGPGIMEAANAAPAKLAARLSASTSGCRSSKERIRSSPKACTSSSLFHAQVPVRLPLEGW
jgi:predicted Rossmann-fold nucleotide-binding protein